MTIFNDVEDFHNKFGLAYTGEPSFLSAEEHKFRVKCLYEELQEYEAAVADKDMSEQLDALIDLVYFAMGTAHRQGFPFNHAFDRVHQANMSKEQKTSNQRRGFHLEVTKPDGWQAPVFDDLLENSVGFENLRKDACGLITVDGCDGSGKTTLAKRIAEVFGGEHIHLTWSPALEEVMDTYRCSAIQYASSLAKEKVVVLERAWLSHPIYSNAYRGGDMHDFGKWRRTAERTQVAGVLALPNNKSTWLKSYEHAVSTREELFSSESSSKMSEVFDMFKTCYSGVNTMSDKYPDLPMLDKSKYISYNYQAVNPVSGIDTWILENLSKKVLGVE